jgi:hypothetical protein
MTAAAETIPTKLIKITLAGFTRVEYNAVVRVPLDATPREISDLARELNDDIDTGWWTDDPHYWDGAEPTVESVDEESGDEPQYVASRDVKGQFTYAPIESAEAEPSDSESPSEDEVPACARNVYVEAWGNDTEDECLPTFARIEVTPDLVTRLTLLRNVCRQNGMTEARVDGGPAFWGPEAHNQKALSLKQQIVVTPEFFWFSGIDPESELEIWTHRLNFTAFREALSKEGDSDIYLGEDEADSLVLKENVALETA